MSSRKSAEGQGDDSETSPEPRAPKAVREALREPPNKKLNGPPPGTEPYYNDFATHDKCLEHIAATVWSFNNGDIKAPSANFNLKAAEKAAKILGERRHESDESRSLLRELARAQHKQAAPAEMLEKISESPSEAEHEAFVELVKQAQEDGEYDVPGDS